jgi:hypothetical protein
VGPRVEGVLSALGCPAETGCSKLNEPAVPFRSAQPHGGLTMLGFFDWRKKPEVTCTIVFDERFCHSAGEGSGGETYEISEGTTEIIFIFERFDAFMSTYLFNHPYLPGHVKQLIPQKKGVFCAQLVQDGLYVCTDRVDPHGRLSLRPASLKQLQGNRRLRTFSSGAIAFGIFQPDTLQFNVLWATMYQANRGAPVS